MNLVFKVIHGPKAKAIKHVKHVKRFCNWSFYLFIESLKTLIFLPVLTKTSIFSYWCTDHAQLLCFCFLSSTSLPAMVAQPNMKQYILSILYIFKYDFFSSIFCLSNIFLIRNNLGKISTCSGFVFLCTLQTCWIKDKKLSKFINNLCSLFFIK